MAQLLIRNLPEQAKAALKRRAGEHGRSMEAEARAILVDIVMPTGDDPVVVWLDENERWREHGGGGELAEIERAAPRDVELS
ncbi:FitA-like ribbon-helix-helix domain-containing protein [Agromyces italicus]|uniref:FitA-like ribbon-helix-helix domain-containing protein n=1 Tax=Agromyces italicus TaxID=279572 RepID=UPI0003B6DFAF|nr:toxin-antitoxin system [Agromyces italicus]